MNRPRLLITGAGGFCGEHACAHFAAAGWRVTGAVRRLPRPGEMPEGAEGVEWRASDLTVPSEVKTLVADARPDAVIHLAGVNAVGPSWDDPASALEANLMGTVYVLEAIRASGRPVRAVVAGSMLRYRLPSGTQAPTPPHPYGLSKSLQVLAAQSWAAMYGLDVIVAEPGNLIGPGRSRGIVALLARYAAETELAAERGQEPPPAFRLSSGTERRDMLDVRDAIRAYELLLAGGEPGRVYPLASGRMITLGELADSFARLARVPLAFEVGSSAAPSPLPADTSALAALGWAPSIPLAQSAGDTLEQMRRLVRSEPDGAANV
ncbi:NAD-dependent epimerase/dehydratase family protein [Paenibacillus methanolicus]|uniref:GDP-4-dehydro-6-deoxy-D-mannose reductase n=1 Tax=Paenibacillus methanolicus TaxID=582686 RepID=A0A5S5BU81_9BACL|nr:NAD-dependent epimerase/dehydratase family protein [Paenibacillus methanolicus]TYP69856.1 GDP-4-dehydro-6-deoxy-D-mannose reductase [Paenibacillus methanolicus]